MSFVSLESAVKLSGSQPSCRRSPSSRLEKRLLTPERRKNSRRSAPPHPPPPKERTIALAESSGITLSRYHAINHATTLSRCRPRPRRPALVLGGGGHVTVDHGVTIGGEHPAPSTHPIPSCSSQFLSCKTPSSEANEPKDRHARTWPRALRPAPATWRNASAPFSRCRPPPAPDCRP